MNNQLRTDSNFMSQNTAMMDYTFLNAPKISYSMIVYRGTSLKFFKRSKNPNISDISNDIFDWYLSVSTDLDCAASFTIPYNDGIVLRINININNKFLNKENKDDKDDKDDKINIYVPIIK